MSLPIGLGGRDGGGGGGGSNKLQRSTGSPRGKLCSSGGGEIDVDDDEEVGEFGKLSIGFRRCRMSSSRYSSTSCSICSVWFSLSSVVVEVEVVETTTGKVFSLAIVCCGNVGISVISNGAV
jgi:hypothetical protein